MHEQDAIRASMDGIAFRVGSRDGEMFYFDGCDYHRSYRGGVDRAYPEYVRGHIDWQPNAPKPEAPNEFH